ncbi:MAG TPA: hypothetical protein PLS15_05045 [Fimbriimonadaceae bacterium]|nr:hypothetical protein [Fimbriimonadaceae bacterium]HRE94282.1 hypothetical protein [Fimbriimonadaceae bacterium]
MRPHVFDPRAGTEMPEISEDYPRSTLPATYPNNGLDGWPIASVRFGLPSFMNLFGEKITRENGWRMARTQFEASDWLVTIDRLVNADEIFKEIRKTKEHVITHQVHVQRLDGSEFSWPDIEDFLDFMYYLFSFACASRRPVCNLVAMDRFERILFRKWGHDGYLGSTRAFSWFPAGFENPFKSLAPGMYKAWLDPNLKEVCRFLVEVLSESNREKQIVDFKFVLAQTALELLANTIYVEAWGNNVADAASKIRGLLLGLGVDVNMPLSLPDLVAEATGRSARYPGESNWVDGPQAIVQIRNMVTHADRKKRQKLFDLSVEARFEASLLAIHYVEMASLWLFGYDGPVSTRVDLPKFIGKHIDSPWPAGGQRPGTVPP